MARFMCPVLPWMSASALLSASAAAPHLPHIALRCAGWTREAPSCWSCPPCASGSPGMTSFEGGRALALALAPSPDPDAVAGRAAPRPRRRLLLRDRGLSGPGGASDVRDDVERAARGGAARGARPAGRAHHARGLDRGARGRRRPARTWPRASPRASTAPDIGAARRVEAALARALDPRGGLLDAASAELASLRRRLAAARRAAADLLRDLAVRLRSHLQESFTTERGGRPVLAVKASSRSRGAGHRPRQLGLRARRSSSSRWPSSRPTTRPASSPPASTRRWSASCAMLSRLVGEEAARRWTT